MGTRLWKLKLVDKKGNENQRSSGHEEEVVLANDDASSEEGNEVELDTPGRQFSRRTAKANLMDSDGNLAKFKRAQVHVAERGKPVQGVDLAGAQPYGAQGPEQEAKPAPPSDCFWWQSSDRNVKFDEFIPPGSVALLSNEVSGKLPKNCQDQLGGDL